MGEMVRKFPFHSKWKKWCAFHLVKNSVPTFLNFSVTKGTAFSIISGKEDNLARYTEISGNSQGACILPGKFVKRANYSAVLK